MAYEGLSEVLRNKEAYHLVQGNKLGGYVFSLINLNELRIPLLHLRLGSH